MAEMASNNTLSVSDLERNRDDDYENMEGNEIMEAPSGDEQDQDSNEQKKKKRYHRHTAYQIEQMEIFFKECPHPDDKQRKELGQYLKLEPLQVKFWFQNKRTQMKTQLERNVNACLKEDNDKLRAEVERYKEALNNAKCPNCGSPTPVGEMSFEEQHLRMENARLREEVNRLSGMAGNNPVGNVVTSTYSNLSSENDMPSHELGGVGNYGEKSKIVEVAVAAMEELTRMAVSGIPLWIPCNYGPEILNQEEYFRAFPRGIGPITLGLRSEASRESLLVLINPINLLEILMDVNQWSKLFCGIVSRATTLEVLSTGVAGNYNGAMQVMSAEFQVASPLVLTRDYYFVRYCKQNIDGAWVVVDVSLDNLRPGTAISRCRRRPSGCLIQELQNGYSKVTWVEHVEVDNTTVHNLYKQLVNCGFAFGAKRWVASLDRQCQRLANTMATNMPAGDRGVITGPDGRKAILNLAERMIISFCTGLGASSTNDWAPLKQTSGDVRVMTKKSMHDPGKPPGLVLSAATSFWLPVPPRRAFDFLRDVNSRSQWDILSNGDPILEMTFIANGRDAGNGTSLLGAGNANSSTMLILQESCIDSTGSYIIYAPVDVGAINVILSGGDPNHVGLLPSGFAIVPDNGPGLDGGHILDVGSGGSILTVAFQILVDIVPTANLAAGSVSTVNNLLKCTVERIKDAMMISDTNAQYQI